MVTLKSAFYNYRDFSSFSNLVLKYNFFFVGNLSETKNLILMASSLFNISTYSRFNISESESDINVFVKEYGYRIKKQLEEDVQRTPFISFTENKFTNDDSRSWLNQNQERFLTNTPNESLLSLNYLSECGFICSMVYSPDGSFLIVGHSSGMIQVWSIIKMDEEKEIIGDFANKIKYYYRNEESPKMWYPMFYSGTIERKKCSWVKENHENFLKGTKNKIMYNRWYCSELGAITALAYAPNGSHIVAGYSSGMIQMRHGSTGTVLYTLRNIQFPPKPVYALEYSRVEERICYAACTDGAVYRIEIPNLTADVEDPPEYCIRADPALESMNTQFFGTPGISSTSTPFVTQRSPALSVGVTADETKIVVGYGDSSIKVYDLETQEAELTYKIHKLRLQFIPKKLQRMHFGQVCALRCHNQRPAVFASGAWDRSLRIWDLRCQVGCVMTFEGVDICSDSIDINRDHCIAGSWQPTEALTVWDLVAKKRLNVIRVQNRRPNVDGEYIHACRYWRSTQYNRKGKYAIIGGGGTNCVEVINLHNRYIACSYPASGSVLAVASHQERIAFGGTAPVLNIVTFHDPKHEDYKDEVETESGYTKTEVTWCGDDEILTLSELDPQSQVQVNEKSSMCRPAVSAISQSNP